MAFDNAGRNRGREELSVPFVMVRLRNLAGILAFEDALNRGFNAIKSLVVTSRGEHFTVFAVCGIGIRIPAAAGYPLYQFLGDLVAFDGQGVVGVGDVAFSDVGEVTLRRARQPWRAGKPFDDITAPAFPHRAQAQYVRRALAAAGQ